jgi:hypothetical protein
VNFYLQPPATIVRDDFSNDISTPEYRDQYHIDRGAFKDVNILMQQLQIWSTTLPPAIYQTYLGEGAGFLTAYVDPQEAKNEEFLAEYYNLARSTHP